jgi:hypothetical protein
MESDENSSFIHSICCSNSVDYEEYYPVRVTPCSAVEIYYTFGERIAGDRYPGPAGLRR